MTGSPISTPDIPDKTPVDTRAIAFAADQTLFALLRVLIKKGVIKADELTDELRSVVETHRPPNGPMDMSDAGKARFAAYLAMDRVLRSLEKQP